jgi:hypothetical protein
MTSRRSTLSLFLAGICLLLAAAPAQEGPPNLQSELEARRAKLAQKRAAVDLTDGDIGEAKQLSASEIEAARRLRGSRGQCRFVTAMRPPKLLPGQQGTLLITAILQGQSVLPAPAQVTMKPRMSNVAVQLGELRARPAPNGKIHEAYRGRPVYENTAVFEVPVTATSQAKLGTKAQISLELEFDIYNGTTGNSVGSFIESVKHSLDIANHVDPEVAGRTARGPSAAPGIPAEPVASRVDGAAAPVEPAATGGGPEPLSGAAAIAVETPEVAPSESGDTSDLPPAISADEALPIPLLVGGGAILLVLVLLLTRRK